MSDYTTPSTGPEAKKKRLKEALERCHPFVNTNREQWITLSKLYEGGEPVRELLVRHQREHEDAFKIRKTRAYYLNYVQQIIDTYTNFIFKKKITRQLPSVDGKEQELPEDIAQFHKNIDRKGSTVDEFMEACHKKAGIHGFGWIVIDMPNYGDNAPMTEQERKERGLNPYAYYIEAPMIKNWALDDDGNFLWCRWKEDPPPNDDPFASEDKDKEKCRYRTWTKTNWVLHEVEGDEIRVVARGDHELERVPVIPLIHKEALQEAVGLSALSDIGPMNLALFQWCSLLDEEMHQKVMNILTMKVDGPEAQPVVIGANNVLTYTGDVPPQFIAPSPAPGEMIMKSVDQFKTEMFRIAHLGGTSNPTQGTTSGISQAFDFNETNQCLAQQADNLQIAEKELHILRALWLHEENELSIDYPEEFGVELMPDELETVNAATETVPSPKFIAVLRKRVARKFLHKESVELVEEICEEIDAASTEEALMKEKEQEDALNAPSPLDQHVDAQTQAQMKLQGGQKAKPKAKPAASAKK